MGAAARTFVEFKFDIRRMASDYHRHFLEMTGLHEWAPLMSILFITNKFPNPVEMTKGSSTFVWRGISEKPRCRMTLRSPGWRKGERWHVADGRFATAETRVRWSGDSLPTLLLPSQTFSRVLRVVYWPSVQGTLRRFVQSSMPEAVLGYWIHPDGEVVVGIPEQLDVPSAVIVGGSDSC